MDGPAPRLLVFDSGLGGLTVLRAIIEALPQADCRYVADDAGFPYGAWDSRSLTQHVVSLVERLVEEHAPDAVVIACNTASTLVLEPLRARLGVPVIGTVPAIKPAAGISTTRQICVLATPGTVSRDYTHDLIRAHGQDCHFHLVGSARLAELAEAHLRGQPVRDEALLAEISPCFVDAEGGRTDTVVLGCTHYPLLLDRFKAIAPWPVMWLDPAPAIARRVAQVLGAGHEPGETGSVQLSFTSGREADAPLLEAIRLLGIPMRKAG